MNNKIIVSIFFIMCLVVSLSMCASAYFDSIGFGVYGDFTGSGPGGSYMDSIGFGVRVDLTTGGGGSGESEWSDWWEFYKLDNRYDVDVNSIVNVQDCGYAYINFDTDIYLYDVDDNDDVNIQDCGWIYVHFT